MTKPKQVTINLVAPNTMGRFKVKSVENSIEHLPNTYLTQEEVQKLVNRKNWKVRIV